MNRSSVIVKTNAGYRCQKCGSDELVQSHHQVPGDDRTQICLCAYHHWLEHPNMPKALFFPKNSQPYWFNKSASSLAQEVGVCSRTIIRMAKKLDIPQGDLSVADEALIIGHLEITRSREFQARKEVQKRLLVCKRDSYDIGYCPYCRSKKKLLKQGSVNGKKRWFCRNCARTTINPLKEPRKR